MLNDQQRRRAFNTIIVTQCLGMIPLALFQNGFYLNYFSKLGISSAAIAMLFALPPLIGSFLLLPFAFYSDRMGKKRLALFGQVLLIASLVLMVTAGWVTNGTAMLVVVSALLFFCVGGSLQGASWFALLNPIIPKEIRGRFFGRLRVTFMTVCILFTLLVTRVLRASQAMASFQILLGIIFVAALFRYFTYARIPELENVRGEVGPRQSFRQALSAVLGVRGFIPFNSYVFLITLFTAGVPIVFGLMQKDVFKFTPAQITLMGTLFLAGSVAGNWLGGRAVDRYGTRLVFLFTHVAYAVVITGMLVRHGVPWSLPLHAGGCSFFFGMASATAGVAVTAEMLGLIPDANKSLSTAINMSLFNLAVALSGMFVSRSISWDMLVPEWSLLGQSYSIYDSLLFIFATMILLMLVTIGLVPKVVKNKTDGRRCLSAD
jgi:MFS family permease